MHRATLHTEGPSCTNPHQATAQQARDTSSMPGAWREQACLWLQLWAAETLQRTLPLAWLLP